MRVFSRMTGWGLLCVVAACMTACNGGPRIQPFTVKVSLDEALASSGASLDVDVVGLSANDPALENASHGEYWGTMRNSSNPYTMQFNAGSAKTQTMSTGDPKWDQWIGREGAEKIRVLVNFLPDTATPNDLVLTLDRNKWQSDVFDIEVKSDRMRCLTKEKVED